MDNASEFPLSNVEAWYLNATDEDPRLLHKYSPNRPVPVEHLRELGVLTWKLDADNWQHNTVLEKIKKERGYNYWVHEYFRLMTTCNLPRNADEQDVATVSPGMMDDYDAKIKHFFTEHLHADEEIRFVLAGGGYFDIRDYDEKWIRFRIQKGDLIVLPAGMYHRFTLDTENFVQAVRLFIGLPCWTQHQRPADHMKARNVYVEKVLNNPLAIHNPQGNVP